MDCLELFTDKNDNLSPVPSGESGSEVFTESYDSKFYEDEEEELPERFLRNQVNQGS